jgi:hypothetical protein
MREVESMAHVRDPRQYVYAVVDGIGWLGRQNDLRKIFDLWTERKIQGLYSLAQMPAFRQDLMKAAQFLGLL